MADDLGLRAARMDWLISLGQQYGYNCGRDFQVYDDYTDPRQAVNQPREATFSSQAPLSLPVPQQIYWDSTTITAAASSGVHSREHSKDHSVYTGLSPQWRHSPAPQ